MKGLDSLEPQTDGVHDSGFGTAQKPVEEAPLAGTSRPVWRMLRNRLLWAVPTLLIVSFVVFLLVDLAPGDVAERVAGETATSARVEAVREGLNLNDPLPVRYGRWLADAVRGDLGESLVTREPVVDIIGRALPPTLSIILVSMTGTIIVAMLLGIAAAMRPGGLVDRVLSVGTAVAIAVPVFVVCLVLVSELAVKRKWLPAIGYGGLMDDPVEWFRHLVIPATALGAIAVGEVGRQLRASLGQVFDQDYILAAYAKGLRRWQVVLKHALKNAAMPVLTVLGTRFALMAGGTVVVETIVVIRGVGWTLVSAVIARDMLVVTGITVVITFLVVLVNLVVDLLYTAVNPRLRAQ